MAMGLGSTPHPRISGVAKKKKKNLKSILLRYSQYGLEKNFQMQSIPAGSEFVKNKEQR